MIGPEITVPDLTEEVIGYRLFDLKRYSQHNYRLVSPHQGDPWMTTTVTAKCNREIAVPEGIVLPGPVRPHKAPQKDCGCGIYVYFDPCPVNEQYDRYLGSFGRAQTNVAAVMSLSGTIEVHARGMRAERATLCALGDNTLLSPDERAGLHEIARALGVPVVPQGELPKIATEFGRPIDDSMRPASEKKASTPGAFVTTASGTTAAVTFEDRSAVARRLSTPPRWNIWLHSGIAALNAAFFATGGFPLVSGVAMTFSASMAAWYAGRRKQGRILA